MISSTDDQKKKREVTNSEGKVKTGYRARESRRKRESEIDRRRK